MIQRKQIPTAIELAYIDANGQRQTATGSPADVIWQLATVLDSFWIERGISCLQLALEGEREADAKREAAIQEMAAKLIAECREDELKKNAAKLVASLKDKTAA